MVITKINNILSINNFFKKFLLNLNIQKIKHLKLDVNIYMKLSIKKIRFDILNYHSKYLKLFYRKKS